MMRDAALHVAVLCAVLAAVAPGAMALSCRRLDTCSECLDDPNCGWCATVGVCVPGTPKGPFVGNCSAWNYNGCGSTPPPAPTPAPTPVPTPAPAVSHPWLGFAGDVHRTSFVPEMIGAHRNVQLRWSSNVPMLAASVCAANGVFYWTAATAVALLYAVNATTGEEIWGVPLVDFNTGGSVSMTLSPRDGLIFVETIENSGVTTLAAYATGTGLVAWNVSFPSQGYNYEFGPVASDGVVYAPTGYQAGQLSAYSAASGTLLFSTQLNSSCDSWGPAMSTDRKSVLWASQSPIGDQGLPFAFVGALDAANGSAVWTTTFNNIGWSGYSTHWYPVVSAGVVLAAVWNGTSSPRQSIIYAVDERWPHALLWQYTGCQWIWETTNSPAADGNYAYINCPTIGIDAVSLQTGKLVKQFACTDCTGPPIVTLDTLFVKSVGGVYAYSLATGERLRTIGLAAPEHIALHAGLLYVVDSAGLLHAYQLQ